MAPGPTMTSSAGLACWPPPLRTSLDAPRRTGLGRTSTVHNCRLPTNLKELPVSEDMSDFRALDPFFRIIEQGLAGLVDGDHFFDLLAQDVVFDFVITVPNYPRHVVGRANLIALYRGYGDTFFL